MLLNHQHCEVSKVQVRICLRTNSQPDTHTLQLIFIILCRAPQLVLPGRMPPQVERAESLQNFMLSATSFYRRDAWADLLHVSRFFIMLLVFHTSANEVVFYFVVYVLFASRIMETLPSLFSSNLFEGPWKNISTIYNQFRSLTLDLRFIFGSLILLLKLL